MVSFNPIIIILLVIALFHIFINATFGNIMLDMIGEIDRTNDMFIRGYGQVYGPLMIVFAIISAFLGVLSLSEERMKNTLNILLTKPVLRRDVILGKVAGLGAFMLSLVILMQLSTGLLLMIYYREPLSISDYLWRLIVFIVSSFLLCMLIFGISMLAGLVLKNTLVATSAVSILIFMDFIGSNIWTLVNRVPIMPSRLLHGILAPSDNFVIFQSSIPFSVWFDHAIPHVVFMALLVIIITLLCCTVFLRQQEVV